MSDKITTLHLKNDPSINIYPNVKIENIPLDATITRDGENLAKTKTIYDFAHLNFLSLDGGTMDGIITINDIGIPEKTILGDGVEVVEVTNPANPATHYGSGYIRQDDDENTSVKYEYNFPKKSGTLALKEDYPSYTDINNFTCQNENFVIDDAKGYAELKNNLLVINAVIKGTSDSTGRIYFNFTLPEALGTLIKPLFSDVVSQATGRIFNTKLAGVSPVFHLKKISNTTFTIKVPSSYNDKTYYSVIFNVLL